VLEKEGFMVGNFRPDSDNGSEFINQHLFAYCQREKITFTLSRSYKKNDNWHVEQKN
jgi:hypothetical protein